LFLPEYPLTDQGGTLMPIFDAMYKGGKNYMENAAEAKPEISESIK
jgi:DNA-binding HxlR family transcriptional regulator